MSHAKEFQLGTATIEELLAIPEEQRRHEIIDGELVEKKATTPGHGLAMSSIAGLLFPFTGKGGKRGPGGWWLAQDCEITFGPGQVYRPDLVGWRRDRVPVLPDTFATDVPDWVCEILSTNRATDTVKKFRVYHHARVAHYWLLDPLDASLSVYRWAPEIYALAQRSVRGEKTRPEPFDAFEFDVGAFFGDDEPEH